MSEFAIPKSYVSIPAGKKEPKKLKDLNATITCSICKGYIIEATTINICLHSFCRSCIVKHLEKSTFCPTCSPASELIYRANLRPDEKLKALIYKLVPGLWQSENRRLQKFNEENNIFVDEQTPPQLNSHSHPREHDLNGRNGYGLKRINIGGAGNIINNNADDDDEHFYAPDDPISLSLEYHPLAIPGCDKSALPPIKYLQCPAAVTVQHLQRFLSSKYTLNMDSGTTQIDIIYEDELQPSEFKLMDVAYTYKWKRVDPMKFFYQIFVVNPSITHETALSSKEVKTSSNNNSNSPLFNVNSNDNSNNHNKKYQNNQEQQQYNSNIQTKSSSSIENSLNNVANVEQLNEANNKLFNSNNDNSNSSDSSSGSINNQDSKIVRFGSVKSSKSNKNATKSVASTSTMQKGKNIDVSANITDDSCYSFSDEKPLKVAFVSTKNAKGSKTYNILPASNGNMSPTVNINKPDIKSLRSNAAYYNSLNAGNDNNDSNTLNNSGTVTPNDSKEYKLNSAKTNTVKTETAKDKSALKSSCETKTKNKSVGSEGKGNRNGNAILNSPNIVVSIPQSRRVSFSDDVFENISLAELKTANKKTKSGTSPKSDSYVDEERRELPKLKIDLTNLKAKITSAKNKERAKKELELSQTNESVLDYFGLKPISPNENSRSPDNKSEDNYEHGHKKRKKSGKHSKEPGSKRRKLHAEISSQEEESLKLKVKITGGKPSKHERKNSSVSSDDNSSSSGTLSDSKDIDSPTVKSPKPAINVDKVQLPKRSTRAPPNASPARPNTVNDDDKEDVVFVSSSNDANHKPMKFVSWKEPQKAPVPKLKAASSPAPNVQPIFAVPVGKPKVAKPQPVTDYRSRGVFSPPHIPNYPPFHLPAPKLVPASPHLAPISAPVKRSTSTEGRSNPPKQPKVDKQAVRKNAIPDLIKATMPIKNNPNPNPNKSPKPNEIFYNSSMSSKYTSEINTKKPLPMQLPPASVSVTEISDSESQSGSFGGGSLVGRPALEIVRISSDMPTVDQQHTQVEKLRRQLLAAQTQKQIRPVPSNIPLLKIQNAANQKARKDAACDGTGVLDLSGRPTRSPSHSPSPPAHNMRQLNVTSSAILPRLVTVSSSNSNNTQSMTIKSSPISIANNFNKNINNYMSGFAPRNTHTTPTSIASASLTNNRGISTDKQPIRNCNYDGMNAITARDRLQSPPPLVNVSTMQTMPMIPAKPTMLSLNTPRLHQIPKLNEIGKSRPNGPVRQQNASVRNVPNPSALAFRNQSVPQKNSNERSSPPTAVSVASTGTITTGPKAQSPTLPAGNRTPTHTSASIDITTSMGRTPTSYNSVSTTTTASAQMLSSLIPISKQLNAPTLNKHNLLNSGGGDYLGVSGSGRNNNNDIIDAKLIASKKNQHTSLEGVVKNLLAIQRLSGNSVLKGSVASPSI